MVGQNGLGRPVLATLIWGVGGIDKDATKQNAIMSVQKQINLILEAKKGWQINLSLKTHPELIILLCALSQFSL